MKTGFAPTIIAHENGQDHQSDVSDVSYHARRCTSARAAAPRAQGHRPGGCLRCRGAWRRTRARWVIMGLFLMCRSIGLLCAGLHSVMRGLLACQSATVLGAWGCCCRGRGCGISPNTLRLLLCIRHVSFVWLNLQGPHAMSLIPWASSQSHLSYPSIKTATPRKLIYAHDIVQPCTL